MYMVITDAIHPYNFRIVSGTESRYLSSFALFIVAITDDKNNWAGFIVCRPFIRFSIICGILCKLGEKYSPLSTHDLMY